MIKLNQSKQRAPEYISQPNNVNFPHLWRSTGYDKGINKIHSTTKSELFSTNNLNNLNSMNLHPPLIPPGIFILIRCVSQELFL